MKNNIDYKYRGLSFEDEIIKQNNTYKLNGDGLVLKRRTGAFKTKDSFKLLITEPDFYGVFNLGFANICYVDFDTKVTSITNFRISNIPERQIEHLRELSKFGSCYVLPFFLIYFSKFSECYILPIDVLNEYQRLKPDAGSIPIKFFRANSEYLKVKSYDYFRLIEDLAAKHIMFDNIVFKLNYALDGGSDM